MLLQNHVCMNTHYTRPPPKPINSYPMVRSYLIETGEQVMLVRQNWSKHRSKWYKVCSVVLLQYQYTLPTFQIQTNTPFIFNGQEVVWLKLREWAMLVRWNLSKHRSKCYKVCYCKIIHTPSSLSKVKQIHEKHLSHWTNCLCFNWQILCCKIKWFFI